MGCERAADQRITGDGMVRRHKLLPIEDLFKLATTLDQSCRGRLKIRPREFGFYPQFPKFHIHLGAIGSSVAARNGRRKPNCGTSPEGTPSIQFKARLLSVRRQQKIFMSSASELFAQSSFLHRQPLVSMHDTLPNA
jgi:hypothetical protein